MKRYAVVVKDRPAGKQQVTWYTWEELVAYAGDFPDGGHITPDSSDTGSIAKVLARNGFALLMRVEPYA